MDRVFGYATGLFVLESGANNGDVHSNSLFLEIGRQWRCLLVEANPDLAPVIRALHRKCHILSVGLSITDGVNSFPFVLAGPLGGIVSEMNKQKRVNSEINEGKPWMAGPQENGSIVQVTCFPLHLVMQVPRVNTVDYLSLDTEGSELAILRATGFTQVEVGVLTVELGGFKARRQGVQVQFLNDSLLDFFCHLAFEVVSPRKVQRDVFVASTMFFPASHRVWCEEW